MVRGVITQMERSWGDGAWFDDTKGARLVEEDEVERALTVEGRRLRPNLPPPRAPRASARPLQPPASSTTPAPHENRWSRFLSMPQGQTHLLVAGVVGRVAQLRRHHQLPHPAHLRPARARVGARPGWPAPHRAWRGGRSERLDALRGVKGQGPKCHSRSPNVVRGGRRRYLHTEEPLLEPLDNRAAPWRGMRQIVA